MTEVEHSARLARQRALVSAVVLIPVPIFMRWVDEPVALFFHAYRDTPWEHVFAVITNLANGVIWFSVALIGICAARLRHPAGSVSGRRETRAWLYMIVVMATSGIVENVLKFAIGRERPRFLFENGSIAFHPFRWHIADSSFPSGHSQSICAAMVSLAFLFPQFGLVFFLIAGAVSASRVIIGAHFVSDVVAGAWLGVAAAIYWRWRFQRRGNSVTLWRANDDRRSDRAASAPPPAQSN